MDNKDLTLYEIEQVLKARLEFHDNLFRRFEKEEMKLEAAVQYNLRQEVQNIARQLLGYYL